MPLCSNCLSAVPPGPRSLASKLTDQEWLDVRAAIARGVTVERLFVLYADKYKNARSFRRCIESRLGPLYLVRGWRP